ncbi:hypothetical protein FGO68_gene2725 [Halteria grandinella]|uniref:RBR-type E3 ubiquitin transferase n=1 Tax=Halteria grandinella TaxID=5974 RepID=A0A8J8NSF0_HALGN|nr:hypothetical protein FGO68_gene2725 [Halteria grandinella]
MIDATGGAFKLVEVVSSPFPTMLQNISSTDSWFGAGAASQNDDGWGDSPEGIPETKLMPQNSQGYVIKPISQIKDIVMIIVERLMQLTTLNEDKTIMMLRKYNWNEEKLKTVWFELEGEDAEIMLRQIGAKFDTKIDESFPFTKATRRDQNSGICAVCYNEFDDGEFAADSLECGHEFCREDWNQYLVAKVNEGFQGCMNAKCLQTECNLKVTHSMYKKHLKEEEFKHYERWFVKSYTDENKNARWCPFKGCEYCAIYQNSGIKDVNCLCGESYCFECGEELHKPASCENLKLWIAKNSSESDSLVWIEANTKKCPNKMCLKPIEKNQGCNHMTCKQCGHHFCWLCLGDWKDHGSATGGYYKCNIYEEAKKSDTRAEFLSLEEQMQRAREELNRFVFHYERFSNHQKSKKHAQDMIGRLNFAIEELRTKQNYTLPELQFLGDTLKVLIRARHGLKYTYVHAYYQKDAELRQISQYSQEMLEKFCEQIDEMLSHFLEVYQAQYIFSTSLTPFYQERDRIISFAKATKQYYENICGIMRM